MATTNDVGNILSGATGSGTFVGATSPTLVTPTLGAASATSLTFSSTTGVVGTTTNNNAASGSVGEYVTSSVLLASAISLSTTTAADVTSISLTAGDWDIFGNVTFTPGATTVVASIFAWVSTTSATKPDNSLVDGVTFAASYVPGQFGTMTPMLRVSISGTTTVYLSCVGTFTTSTLTACGSIFARRTR